MGRIITLLRESASMAMVAGPGQRICRNRHPKTFRRANNSKNIYLENTPVVMVLSIERIYLERVDIDRRARTPNEMGAGQLVTP